MDDRRLFIAMGTLSAAFKQSLPLVTAHALLQTEKELYTLNMENSYTDSCLDNCYGTLRYVRDRLAAKEIYLSRMMQMRQEGTK
jgi:hypothetical protein